MNYILIDAQDACSAHDWAATLSELESTPFLNGLNTDTTWYSKKCIGGQNSRLSLNIYSESILVTKENINFSAHPCCSNFWGRRLAPHLPAVFDIMLSSILKGRPMQTNGDLWRSELARR